MKNMQKLDKIMNELGHQERQIGTYYIREAVAIYDRARQWTKDLYPALAEAAGAGKAANVERAMRHSIQSAWGRGSYEEQQRLFGHSVDPERGAPCVSEYVARLAREIDE